MNTKLAIVVILAIALFLGGYFLLGGRDGGNKVSVTDSSRQQAVVEVEVEKRSANYVDFSVDAYKKAKDEGRVIMLYFMANWCSTCRAQEPVNLEAFEELEEDSDIVVFRTHILDSETTEETEALADEFGVRLQHTFVILNPQGEVTFTHTGPLDKDDLIENLTEAKE
jgi:thiol:disulfide interchange protein